MWLAGAPGCVDALPTAANRLALSTATCCRRAGKGSLTPSIMEFRSMTLPPIEVSSLLTSPELVAKASLPPTHPNPPTPTPTSLLRTRTHRHSRPHPRKQPSTPPATLILFSRATRILAQAARFASLSRPVATRPVACTPLATRRKLHASPQKSTRSSWLSIMSFVLYRRSAGRGGGEGRGWILHTLSFN